MTKIKSKKMTKSTFAIIIMAIIMVAMLAFGGTYAYFTATASDKSATFTTGSVKLTSTGDFATITAGKGLMPGDYIIGDKDSAAADPAASVTVDTTDKLGNYVAVKFTLAATKADTDSTPFTDEELTATGLKVVPDAATWIEIDATNNIYAYKGDGSAAKAVENGTYAILTSGIQFKADDEWKEDSSTTEGYISEHNLMGATITITMQAKSIQASNIDAADVNKELLKLFGITAA